VLAAEEAASKAGELAQAEELAQVEELAQAVVLAYCFLAAAKLEHSALECTAAVAAPQPQAWVQ